MIEEQRIPFPDYTPEEQKRDAAKAERLNKVETYISKVDGVWYAIIPDHYNIVIRANNGDEIEVFYNNLSKLMAKMFKLSPRIRNIQNVGVDEYLRNTQAVVKKQNILGRKNNGRD